ncbi:MAG TPA: glycosyltransferase family 2 protein [Gammaproteobacteria bacterium]|nr:glycosyltransferase family 2 protein [Gammaproteobacteria bacterium]
MNVESEQLISVIIPTYNRADLIGRTIDSVLAQSWQDLEIVVVDDASTDDTRTVVQAIPDPRVRYIGLEKNSGPSTARNTGVEQAKGRFISFLDSDDEWCPEKTARQFTALTRQTNPDNVVCYTQALIVQNDGTRLLPTRRKRADESVGDYVICGSHGLIHTSSLMLPRTLALANPFPVDQKIFEDWDLFLRLEENGVQWLYLDEPLITWHNDAREGRLTSSRHDGSDWLDTHRRHLSKKAQKAFTIKGIVRPLMRARERKWYTLKSLVWAFPGSNMSIGEALKQAIKIFVPPDLIKRVKVWPPARSPR